jgi:methionyl-tRNA synthetase
MPETPQKFFLTTPIYYVNARPHIGHAYTTIVADVLARRSRAQGVDTYFLTGTDEHGQKIERSAAAAGIPPQQFADEVSATFSTLWQRMGITHDDFIRTTSARHKRGVQKLFQTLKDNGKIELRSYTGSYCVSDEAFVDLPAGTPCPDCGRPLETVTEQNYFFKLSEYQLPLINLIESGQLAIQPDSRRNEVLSFLRGPVSTFQPPTHSENPVILSKAKDPCISPSSELPQIALSAAGTLYIPGTLKDLSISRTSFKWGIPVPGDESHVIYVWLDALANYMTALGYGSEDDTLFQKFWPADLHIVGKEIIRFHCVYWPAFLLAAGLPIPKEVVAHGWLLFEESKMSKSKGNIVRTETILDAFGPLCPPAHDALFPPEKTSVILSEGSRGTLREPQSKDPEGAVPATFARTFLTKDSTSSEPAPISLKHHQDLFAADILRYFLLREIPFGQDGSFSFDALITRYNADLANGYGNLVSRTLTLIGKSHNSEIRLPSNDSSSFRNDLENALSLFHTFFEAGDYSRALSNLWMAVEVADGYVTANAPWKLAKSEEPHDADTLRTVLYNVAEAIRLLTLRLNPILPYATTKVWAQLGLDPADLTSNNKHLASWGGLKPGTKLGPLSPIFPRADKGLAQIMNDI